MDEQQEQPQPVTYVGGLGEAPKRAVWPYAVLGLVPVIIAIAAIVLWNPIRSLGRTAGATLAPYSLVLESGRWSSDQKIATVPITLNLTVANGDQRPMEGITLRFTKLDPRWEIVAAGSTNASAEVNGRVIYFPVRIPPGNDTTLSVTLLPKEAMDSEIDLTLTPAHGTTAARIQLPDGSVTSKLLASGKVREPTDADANARLTAFYDPAPTKGDLTILQIHVANTGPVTINGVRLRFPNIPDGLDLRAPSGATVLADRETVQFDVTLVPGGQTLLQVGVVPQASGHFELPVAVYLGQSNQPLTAANGGPPLNIDLTVD